MNVNKNMNGTPQRPIWEQPTPQQPTIAISTSVFSNATFANNQTQLGYYSVRDYGADNTGTTSSNASFTATQAAAGTSEIWIPPGTYSITSNFTFTSPVVVAPGAILAVSAGVTLTISGSWWASPVKCFSGAGTVVFSAAPPAIYAEWFGAVGNGTTSDSAAINLALGSITTGGLIQLLARPYKLTTTLTFASHSTVLAGAAVGLGPYDSGTNLVAGTQLIGTNGTNGILVSGYDMCVVRDLSLSLATGATSASVGITVTGCFYPKLTNLRLTNWSTGVAMVGSNSDSYINGVYCTSKSVTVTPVIGFDINGTTAQNATMYLAQCVSAHATFTGSAYGYYLHGTAIADTYFDSCESDLCTYAWYVNGSGVSAGLGADIHLRGCVADSFVTYGIFITSFAVDSALEVVGGWAATSGGGGIGVYVSNSSARVLVADMQVYSASQGIYIQNSSQGTIVNNMILYPAGNAIVIDASTACTIANNQAYQKSAVAGSAVVNLLAGSQHNTIMGNVANASIANSWAYGILAATTCDYCNVIGNVMPSAAVTTPYSLNLGANTHTVQLGTTA
jgi:parallel beta-helix repeat protein